MATQYDFGFEATSKAIVHEWLYFTKSKKEHKLFERKENDFDITNKFIEGNGLEDKANMNPAVLKNCFHF